MILEDQILAYLDGTLGEEASAELLHVLSVSPEKRALLEEHLKMKDIFALGQRPYTVPTSVERSLASRIPALAERESEAIAPIFRYRPATSAFSGIFASIRSFIGGHTVATALSFGSVVAASGILWYTFERESPMVASNHSTQRQSSHSISQDPRTLADNLNASSSDGLSSSRSQANNSNASNAVAAGSTIHNAANSNAASHVSVNRKHANEGTLRNPLFANHRETQTPRDQRIVNVSNPQSSTPQVNGNDSPGNENMSNASITPVNAKTVSAQVARNNAVALKPLALDLSDGRVHPVTVGMSYGSYQYQLPTGSLVDSSMQSSLQNPEFSLAVDVSDHLTLGLEYGSQLYATVVNSAAQRTTTIGGYSRVTYSSMVKASQAQWSRVMVRYNLNPLDEYKVSASASGGVAFQDQMSPNVAMTLGVSRAIMGNLMMDLGVVGSGTWSTVAPGAPVAPITFDKTQTVGTVRSEVTNSQKTFIPAFGLRAGLSYRL